MLSRYILYIHNTIEIILKSDFTNNILTVN